MISDFFRKLVIFSNKNGQIIVFFGLIILSMSFISMGMTLKKLEDHRFEYNNIVNNRLEIVKAKFEIKYDELNLKFLEAQKVFDTFKNEYSDKLNEIKKNFEVQLEKYDFEQEKIMLERNNETKTKLIEIENEYKDAINDLFQYRKNIEIELKKLELDNQKTVNDINRRIEQEFIKITENYSKETTKLSQVRAEIEVLLDELQKDFEQLEKILSEKIPSETKTALQKLFLVRVKLNVSLTEYRDNLKKKNELEIPYIETKLKTQIPMTSFEDHVFTKFPHFERHRTSHASEKIDIAAALNMAGSSPEFTAQAPEIDLDKILSVKGLVELVGTGYAWAIPTVFGFILFLFSIFYGLFLIQEEKIRVSPNIDNSSFGVALTCCC